MRNWLESQQQRAKSKIKERINNVLEHGQYIMGPEVYELESQLSKYVGCEYAISCSSGTDAILMALMAFGVKGPGVTIFTTPFSFIATAEVAALLGATIFFVDIDPKTFNIDPDKLKERVSSMGLRNAAGVIAVDMFGLPADYNRLRSICAEYEMFLIEDAAQSFGARFYDKKAGSLTDIGCTSFFPSKPLGCYGDGGMCFTDNMTFKNIMESIRTHGKYKDKYHNVRVGLNARLDTIQAAILLEKFYLYKTEFWLRQRIASQYNEMLKDVPNIQIPYVPAHCKSAWAQYSILAENSDHREYIRNKLINEGFDSPIYYPTPLHLQPVFKSLCYSEGSFPVAEDVCKRIFSIPIHPYLTKFEQEKIVEVIT